MMDFWLPPKPAIILPAREVQKPVGFKPAWLPGIAMPFAPGGAVTPPSSDFRTSAVIGVTQTTFDFGSLDIGAADSTRIVIVGVSGFGTSAAPTSVTVGGSGATQRVALGASTLTNISLYSIAVSSGTTANVTVTFAANHQSCGVGVWRLINAANSTPNFTASDNTFTSNALNVTIDIPSLGSLFCMAGNDDKTTPRTWTWTNATERFDATVAASESHSGASETGMTTETGRSITATMSGGSSPVGALVAMSWN